MTGGNTTTIEDAISTLENSANTLAAALGPQPDPGPGAITNVDRILAVSAQLDALTASLS